MATAQGEVISPSVDGHGMDDCSYSLVKTTDVSGTGRRLEYASLSVAITARRPSFKLIKVDDPIPAALLSQGSGTCDGTRNSLTDCLHSRPVEDEVGSRV